MNKENFSVGRSDEAVRKEIHAIRQELRKAQMSCLKSENLHDVCDKLDTAIQFIRDLRASTRTPRG